MGSVEGYTRRVKRWRGGQMIQRWVASALVEAEPRFRRVRGYRDLPLWIVSAPRLLIRSGNVVSQLAGSTITRLFIFTIQPGTWLLAMIPSGPSQEETSRANTGVTGLSGSMICLRTSAIAFPLAYL